MSKRKGHFFTLELRPYDYVVAVSVGQTDRELGAQLREVDRKHGINITGEMLEGVAKGPAFMVSLVGKERRAFDSFMYLKYPPVALADQGVLMHECLHVVRHCLRRANITMGGNNGEEAYCYLLEWMWKAVMERVVRSGSQKSKSS